MKSVVAKQARINTKSKNLSRKGPKRVPFASTFLPSWLATLSLGELAEIQKLTAVAIQAKAG